MDIFFFSVMTLSEYPLLKYKIIVNFIKQNTYILTTHFYTNHIYIYLYLFLLNNLIKMQFFNEHFTCLLLTYKGFSCVGIILHVLYWFCVELSIFYSSIVYHSIGNKTLFITKKKSEDVNYLIILKLILICSKFAESYWLAILI